MFEQIKFEDFQKIEMRVGQIISAKLNPKAKIPAYVLEINFGETLGTKISSAQLTQNYSVDDLIGKNVVCVLNFDPKRVAGIKSEVLVLGALSSNIGTKLLFIDSPIELGSLIG